jgi:YD repeat-containing protein
MRDGTVYTFPDSFGAVDPSSQALVGITDRYGNKVSLTRDSNHNLTQITSSSGRYITLQYDGSNRITSATDNIGRTLQYTYDSGGRLSTVTDANGGVTTYTYNSQNELMTIKDARNTVYLTNEYDANGRVTHQTLADGGTYQFAWTPSTNASQLYFVNGGINNISPTSPAFRYCSDCSKGFSALMSQVDVTDPRGYVRRVNFNASGYTISDVRALGQPEQQTTTYEYYADNLLKSVTDPLGNKTSYDYDVNGNRTRTTRLDGTPQAVTSTAIIAMRCRITGSAA